MRLWMLIPVRPFVSPHGTPRKVHSLTCTPSPNGLLTQGIMSMLPPHVSSSALRKTISMAPPDWDWTSGSNPCDGFMNETSVCCALDLLSSCFWSNRTGVDGCDERCPWKYVTCKGWTSVGLTIRGESLHGRRSGLDLTPLSDI